MFEFLFDFLLEGLFSLLTTCRLLTEDERGHRSWSGAFILMGILLAAVGVVFFLIWLVGIMAKNGHA